MDIQEDHEQQIDRLIDALDNWLEQREFYLANSASVESNDRLRQARADLKEGLAVALMPFLPDPKRDSASE